MNIFFSFLTLRRQKDHLSPIASSNKIMTKLLSYLSMSDIRTLTLVNRSISAAVIKSAKVDFLKCFKKFVKICSESSVVPKKVLDQLQYEQPSPLNNLELKIGIFPLHDAIKKIQKSTSLLLCHLDEASIETLKGLTKQQKLPLFFRHVLELAFWYNKSAILLAGGVPPNAQGEEALCTCAIKLGEIGDLRGAKIIVGVIHQNFQDLAVRSITQSLINKKLIKHAENFAFSFEASFPQRIVVDEYLKRSDFNRAALCSKTDILRLHTISALNSAGKFYLSHTLAEQCALPQRDLACQAISKDLVDFGRITDGLCYTKRIQDQEIAGLAQCHVACTYSRIGRFSEAYKVAAAIRSRSYQSLTYSAIKFEETLSRNH